MEDDDGCLEGCFGGALEQAKNSCGLMVMGFVLFPLSLYCVGWNENNYVCEQKRILFADGNAKEVKCDSSDVKNEFIYFSCPLDPGSFRTFKAEDFFTDGAAQTFYHQMQYQNITFESVSARMIGEMAQCQENCKTTTRKINGQNVKETSCSYKVAWSKKKESTAYQRPSEAAEQCPDLQKYRDVVRSVPDSILGDGDTILTKSDVKTEAEHGARPFILNTKLVGQLMPDSHAGELINAPQGGPQAAQCSGSMPAIGCVRISFYKNDASAVSVFTHADVGGETNEQPMPSAWGCPGKPWQRMVQKTVSKDDAVEAMKSENDAQVIILRVVLVILAWLSLYCILSPISEVAHMFGGLANMIPCIGGYLEDFIEGVVDSILCIISCSVGLSCSLFVMALVWLFMRPLYGCGMLLVCAMLCACCCGVRQAAGAPGKRRRGSGQARDVSCEMPQSVSHSPTQMMAQPMMVQPTVGQPMTVEPVPAQPMMVQPVAAPPAVAMAQPIVTPQIMQVICPQGAGPGSQIIVQATDGRQLQVAVPQGIGPGMAFQVQV